MSRSAPHARRVARWLQWLLLAVGVVSLGYYGYVQTEARLYQDYENRQLDAILQSGPRHAEAPEAGRAARHEPPPGTVLGRIEIPRLHVSAIVRVGSDARTLRLAVGYIPGTALPGEPGNVGLAGHRDTFFRQLRRIKLRDEIRIVTPRGTYRYRVERTRVVDPQDVWVLNPTVQPMLTLVTCYPFTYIGSAPQRFIVRAAQEVSAAATS
ncbi:MAG TPA: class D sortase [Vicinamibacterales bacterium]|nr:class D sortase [Vicinamibacterales bacterium]